MKIIYSNKETLHHPQHEWSNGKLIPYQEKNIRAEIIKNEVVKDGMGDMLIDATEFPLDYIKTVMDSFTKINAVASFIYFARRTIDIYCFFLKHFFSC